MLPRLGCVHGFVGIVVLGRCGARCRVQESMHWPSNSWIPEFLKSWIPEFLNSWIPVNSWIPEFLNSWIPEFLNSWIPEFREFLWIPEFLNSCEFAWIRMHSGIQEFRNSGIHRNSGIQEFTEFRNSGSQEFGNSRNSGIHRNSGIQEFLRKRPHSTPSTMPRERSFVLTLFIFKTPNYV